MAGPDFLIHEDADTVGVVVVEDVTAGKTLRGLNMHSQASVELVARDDIPLGHKIALTDIAADDTILKYGHDIGRAVAAIAAGGHVHVQNVKTKRW